MDGQFKTWQGRLKMPSAKDTRPQENPEQVFAQLPLVLAGPILRRTERQQVSVWIALKQSCRVTLQIYATEQDGRSLGPCLGSAQASTLAIGTALHLVVVTVQSPDLTLLESGQIYAYDLTFNLAFDLAHDLELPPQSDAEFAAPIPLASGLCSPRLPTVSVSYFDHGLPTFALDPVDLNHLRIFHGSCRKLGGEGNDALQILDLAIAHTAHQANHRPHQLFLTGDQIYGDEMNGPCLAAIIQAEALLLGWEEPLPLPPDKGVAQLEPGQRKDLAEEEAGLTASLKNTPEKASNHLFRLGEYCSAYLFSWSQCLWQLPFLDSQTLGLTGKTAQQWNQTLDQLKAFANAQHRVRRALANIPTYMIFDDHDVSDDWNLNQAWCYRVFEKPLGQRVVFNALLAYALFQGWGNTPDRLQSSRSGILGAIAQWCTSQGRDLEAQEKVWNHLGLPHRKPISRCPQFEQDQDAEIFQRDTQAIPWHYTVQGLNHQVLVLDTRTWRGYCIDKDPTAPAQLLCHRAIETQLSALVKLSDPSSPANTLSVSQSIPKLTFVVVPTNLFGLKLLDQIQTLARWRGDEFDMDVGDSWNQTESNRNAFLRMLFEQHQRVVVLSGDIHFSSSIRLEYWHRDRHPHSLHPSPHRLTQEPPQVLVQLTASAMCNSELLTALLHSKLKNLFPESSRQWIGWDSGEQEERSSCALSRWWRRWRQHQPAPDWQYKTTWSRRRPCSYPDWAIDPEGLRNIQHQDRKFWQRLWQSRWIQEGSEVVGRNNIGSVRLLWSEETEQYGTIHELYWYAPWESVKTVVCSHFWTAL